jgi:hypothetical protein
MVELGRLEKWLLYSFVLLLPFNLFVGIVLPALVFLPLYLLDIIILILGISFLVYGKNRLQNEQRYIVFLLLGFILLGSIGVAQQWSSILAFVMSNSIETVIHTLFKKLLSSDPLHGINKIFHLFMGLIIFVVVATADIQKKRLLQIASFSVLIILFANIFLVVTAQDVKLDAGKVGSKIVPYGIVENGRAYFPFVNALLLSLFLSCFFFVFLSLIVHEKRVPWRNGYSGGLFLLILVLGFTKGRAALGTVVLLFGSLCLFSGRQWKDLSRKFLCCLWIFLILVSFYVFVFPDFRFGSVFDDSFDRENSEDVEIIDDNVEVSEEKQEVKEILEEKQERIANQYTHYTNQRRLYQHWPTALILFEEVPLFGVGTGMFYHSVVEEQKDVLCMTEYLCPDKFQPTDISSTAHSIYLQVLVENGIVGFGLFLALLGSIVYFGMKRAKKDSCYLFLLVIVLGILIQGLLMSYFEYMEIVYLFWFFAGLLMKT